MRSLGNIENQGGAAMRNGLKRSDCPYAKFSPEADAWIEGWEEANFYGGWQ